MARKYRSVWVKIIENDELNELEMGVRGLFVFMILLADDEGRLKATPSYLRRKLNIEQPLEDIEHALGSLHARGFIKMYGSITKRFALIPNFKKYQAAQLNTPSELPAPCRQYPYLTVNPNHADGPLWMVEVPNFPALVDEHFQDKYAPGNGQLDSSSGQPWGQLGTNSVQTATQLDSKPFLKHASEQGSRDFSESSLLYNETGNLKRNRKNLPPTPSAISALDVEDEKLFVEQVSNKLAGVIDNDPQMFAEQLLWKARAPHPKTKTRFPLTQWAAAVDVLVDRVAQGRMPEGDPVGYLIGIVPTAGFEMSIRSDVVGTARPESEMTPDELAAYRRKKEADEIRRMLGEDGESA